MGVVLGVRQAQIAAMIRRAEAMVIKEECKESLKTQVHHISPHEATLKTSEDGLGAADKGPPLGIDCVRVRFTLLECGLVIFTLFECGSIIFARFECSLRSCLKFTTK